jgi:aryl-alcohol dehydrogenase-like predicted oxidoreductase
MDQVALGSTGTRVSEICLGTMGLGSPEWRDWVIGGDEAVEIVERALELGVNFLDTADMYSRGESERIVGEAIDGHRDEVVLATKVYHPMSDDVNDRGLSRRHVLDAIDRSLERLGTDHVDLEQIHRYDRSTPIDETLEALDRIVRDGKARYLGTSTMWAWQFAQMLERQRANDWHTFAIMQNHYNLLYREEEREMLPFCREESIGVTRGAR